jgi:hypothetical protein
LRAQKVEAMKAIFGAMVAALWLATSTMTSTMAWAEGDLATEPQRLPDLMFGVDEAGLRVSSPDYELETGKAYQLTIISSGRREYAIRGDEFFNTIWLRKIEVGDVEIKVNGLYELEMEREGQATIIFVPIRPGRYRIYAKGLDTRGAVANIRVK